MNDVSNTDEKPKRKKRKSPSNSVEQLSQTLLVLHAGISTFTHIPELAINEIESDALANSIARVIDEFGIEINTKVDAVVGLIITSASIYAPRLIAIAQKKGDAKTDDCDASAE